MSLRAYTRKVCIESIELTKNCTDQSLFIGSKFNCYVDYVDNIEKMKQFYKS